MPPLNESDVERAALAWLEGLGWNVAHGPNIAPDTMGAERADYGQVILEQRLRDALTRLNPDLPAAALDDAFRQLNRPEGPTLETRNRAFHRMLVEGVTVEYHTDEGAVRGSQVRMIDFDDPTNNDWLAVNQFTVVENKHERRPDIALFVNGLPLGVIELKNPADEEATIWTAWQQLQTYQAELPTLFAMNAALNGLGRGRGADRHSGPLGGNGSSLGARSRVKRWPMCASANSKCCSKASANPGDSFLWSGISSSSRMTAAVHSSRRWRVTISFTQLRWRSPRTLRAAELIQTNERLEEKAVFQEPGRKPGGAPGDRRIGVVWHTQGSGKSLSMAFYAGRIIREPSMANPTIVVLTDRNDLDDQLFGTFSRCQELLRQPPAQAASRADLRAQARG